MTATLAPPRSLRDCPYFVVKLERGPHQHRYTLLEPERAQSFDLGDAFKARAYLERAAGEYLGGRALDSATAFGASQAIPSKNVAYGLDLCRINLDSHTFNADQSLTAERLFGEDDNDQEVIG